MTPWNISAAEFVPSGTSKLGASRFMFNPQASEFHPQKLTSGKKWNPEAQEFQPAKKLPKNVDPGEKMKESTDTERAKEGNKLGSDELVGEYCEASTWQYWRARFNEGNVGTGTGEQTTLKRDIEEFYKFYL